ncbi:MAG: hypothetical protein B7X30_11350, partial [Thiomonas sp. 13-64-67]
LHHLSPVQALKKWQAKKPDLFVKRVYNQPGLDTQRRHKTHDASPSPFNNCLKNHLRVAASANY